MKGDGTASLILFTLALALRLVPLAFSPLPYNIDGFSQARLAEGAMESGSWLLSDPGVNSYNSKTPLLPLLLVGLAHLTGVPPLLLCQMAIPLVGSLGIPAIYLLARRLGCDRTAAVASGLFLALFGTFVFLTSSTMKGAFGLGLLPLLLLSYHLRLDRRHRMLSFVFMILMPFVHSLTALVALGFSSTIALLQYARSGSDRSLGRPDLLQIGTAWLITTVYYFAVRMEYFVDIASQEELPLLLAVAFSFTLVALLIASPHDSRGRHLRSPLLNGKVFFVLGGQLMVLANYRRPIFAGTAPTQEGLLIVAGGLLILSIIGVAGLDCLRRSAQTRAPIGALLAVPLGMIVFALLRRLDPASFVLTYRSFDYLDIGLALCVGAGASYLARTGWGRRLVAPLLVGGLLLTLPAAFLTVQTFGVENVTRSAELAALDHFASVEGYRLTDQRYADTLAFYWEEGAEARGPFDLASGNVGRGRWFLASEAWTTEGAQIFPLPRFILDTNVFHNAVDNSDLVYTNSAGIYVFRSV